MFAVESEAVFAYLLDCRLIGGVRSVSLDFPYSNKLSSSSILLEADSDRTCILKLTSQPQASNEAMPRANRLSKFMLSDALPPPKGSRILSLCK